MELLLASPNPFHSARGITVCSVPTEVAAAERARWLAELSEALDDANRMINQLKFGNDQLRAAQELHLQIEAARMKVQALRLSRSINGRTKPDPEWTDPAPWHPFSPADG